MVVVGVVAVVAVVVEVLDADAVVAAKVEDGRSFVDDESDDRKSGSDLGESRLGKNSENVEEENSAVVSNSVELCRK